MQYDDPRMHAMFAKSAGFETLSDSERHLPDASTPLSKMDRAEKKNLSFGMGNFCRSSDVRRTTPDGGSLDPSPENHFNGEQETSSPQMGMGAAGDAKADATERQMAEQYQQEQQRLQQQMFSSFMNQALNMRQFYQAVAWNYQSQQQQLAMMKWSSMLEQQLKEKPSEDPAGPPTSSAAPVTSSAGPQMSTAGTQPSSAGPRLNMDYLRLLANSGFMRPQTQRTHIDMGQFRQELKEMTAAYRACMTPKDSDIERAASNYRSAATTERHMAVPRWEGHLRLSHPASVTYSRKVFLGGVPWDITDSELAGAFGELGRLEIVWPQHRERRLRPTRGPQPRGYCYLIFQDENQVKQLLAHCQRRADDTTYFRISNIRAADKEVQVIPWCISDASFATRGLHSSNAKTTVFVGALHGMITAANLAVIMSEAFGDVVCAALDTDRFKYPIGSGRVVFADSDSYRRAVEANFLEVKTPKFCKTIQIDPYLEDSMCSVCFFAPGVYFCRATTCFQYYCPLCWQSAHGEKSAGDPDEQSEKRSHKPLRRTFRNPIDRKFS